MAACVLYLKSKSQSSCLLICSFVWLDWCRGNKIFVNFFCNSCNYFKCISKSMSFFAWWVHEAIKFALWHLSINSGKQKKSEEYKGLIHNNVSFDTERNITKETKLAARWHYFQLSMCFSILPYFFFIFSTINLSDKDRGYFRVLSYGAIDLLLIQYEHHLSANALKH